MKTSLTACALLASLTAGCSTVAVTATCGKNPLLWQTGPNVVMLPFGGEEGSLESRDQVTFATQLLLASAAADLKDVKVVRLLPDPKKPGACDMHEIEREWSGCAERWGSPALLTNEPVILVWADVLGGEEALQNQYNVAMWHVRRREAIELDTGHYKFAASIPNRAISFQAHPLSFAELKKVIGSLDYQLRESPSFGAPRLPISVVTPGVQFHVLKTQRVNDITWIRVRTNGEAVGWVPLTDQAQLEAQFPELVYVTLAMGYFAYLDRARSEAYKLVADAFTRYRALTKASPDARGLGFASMMAGTIDLLAGARTKRRELIEAAHAHFAMAVESMPESADARNLQLLSTLLSCCADLDHASISSDPITIRSSLWRTDRPNLTGAFELMREALNNDPTNTDSLFNMRAVLAAASEGEIPELSGLNVKTRLDRTESLIQSISKRGAVMSCPK